MARRSDQRLWHRGAAGFDGVAFVDLLRCVANDLRLLCCWRVVFGGVDMAVLACRFEGRVRVL